MLYCIATHVLSRAVRHAVILIHVARQRLAAQHSGTLQVRLQRGQTRRQCLNLLLLPSYDVTKPMFKGGVVATFAKGIASRAARLQVRCCMAGKGRVTAQRLHRPANHLAYLILARVADQLLSKVHQRAAAGTGRGT